MSYTYAHKYIYTSKCQLDSELGISSISCIYSNLFVQENQVSHLVFW